MAWDVFVTRPIPEPGLLMLRAHCRVTLRESRKIPTREEIIAGIRDKDAILCLLTDPIDRAVIDAAGPRLKVISNYAVGFDNIDVAYATAQGIVVTNTPGVLTETTADLAWALLMAAARRIVEADRFTRAGRYDGWDPMLFLGWDVHGKTLGIVGLGRIGQAVARRARGFQMRVLYYDAYRPPAEVERDLGVTYVPFDTLIQEADFISVHTPLTPETRHMFNAEVFRRMKPTAILVNTSRGPVIDEAALVEALRERRIAYAALDVFEHEPALTPGLAELDNVVLVPHIGSASLETRAKMAELAAANVLAVMNGQRPPHLVNPDVWDRRRKT